mgnify:CR=1 FL=1
MRKVVIPAAGFGTRLLTATKEMPKEMLPVFSKDANGGLRLKPALEVIFEELHNFGIRDFCFVVGRTKRAVEDHFTPDLGFLEFLSKKNKDDLAGELNAFYKKIADSNIIFVNQPEPRGFGDAVYRAKAFTSNESFLVHAGDDIILAEDSLHLQKLVELFEETHADAAFLVQKVEDPRKYGVITGVELKPGIHEVTDIVEKPEKPPSNIATVGVYVFTSKIYQAIEKAAPDEAGELQLTDAIKNLLLEGKPVYAIELLTNRKRIDIGTPASYWDALRETLLASGSG